MKKVFFILGVFTFLSLSVKAQTNISGFISTNTLWNLAGSPYIIVGNTLISHGYTLTIEPGVEVKFNFDKALQIDGQLVAIGTEENRISFTANQINPTTGDWAKIHFSDTCMDAVFNSAGEYVSGSIMKYCDVNYGGGLGFGSIQIDRASPYFSKCRIMNSFSSGIYSYGSTYIIDSSSVKNCLDFGLNFRQYMLVSCDLSIKNDTIENNRGGIYLEADYNPNCKKVISNNYFALNTINSTIYVGSVQNLVISENHFINNSAQSIFGIVYFHNSSEFSIACNDFINNNTDGVGVIDASCNGFINDNLFEGNTSTSGVSVLNLRGTNNKIHCTNNLIKNNISGNGSCVNLYPQFGCITQMMFFDYNQFFNNQGQSILKIINSYQNAPPPACLYLKNNNFSDPNMIELCNEYAFGSANIYADSNYWGSSNTQHVDSVIFDYFDFANKSVVYYTPILTAPVTLDTTCSIVVTGIEPIMRIVPDLTIYPNPTSHELNIVFNIKIMHGRLDIFDLMGKKVFTDEIFQSDKKSILLPQLCNGLYIVRIFDGKNYQSKKLEFLRN